MKAVFVCRTRDGATSDSSRRQRNKEKAESQSNILNDSSRNNVESNEDVNINVSRPESHGILTRRHFRFHSRINFMIVISSSFFVCTLPATTAALLDIFGSEIDFSAALISSKVFLILYTFVSPIILMNYLPHMKSMVIVLFQKCNPSRIQRGSKRDREKPSSVS